MKARPTLLQIKGLLRDYASKAPSSRVEILLSLTRTLAIVIAGVWALGMYFSHQRQFHQLVNEHQRLANEQANLTIKQSVASAEYDLARSKLAAETAALQNQLARLQIRDQTASGALITHDLAIDTLDERENAYGGTFEISVHNASKSRLEVSWVVFELYIGSLSHPNKNDTITYINPPPKKELEQEQRGPVTWIHQGSFGYLYPDSKLLDYQIFKPYDYFQMGGGLTKSLAAGDSSSFRLPLFIKAPRNRWVAVVAIIGIDGAVEGAGIFSSSDWVDLRGLPQRARPAVQ